MNAKEKILRESYIKHAVMAQLYRWWQYYDDKGAGPKNQLDILDENILVCTPNGETRGHAAFAAAIGQLPATWKNAHLHKSSNIEIGADGTVTLTTEIDYLNQGMQEDGSTLKSSVSYQATLCKTDALLPKFTSIRIEQGDVVPVAEFTDSFEQNRIRSLVHYFTALVENPARDPEPFREVLADKFSLHYLEEPITDFEGVKVWATGQLASVVASRHVLGDISYTKTAENDFVVTIEMESEALFPNGDGITSKNKQTWTLTNQKTERFARIRKITIDRDKVQRFPAKAEA